MNALKNYPFYNGGDKDIVKWIAELSKKSDSQPIYKLVNIIGSYTGGSRSALGRHLLNASPKPRPKPSPDCEAHHIIPYDMWAETKEGLECRRILRDAGFVNERGIVDINNAMNGAWVPDVDHNYALHSLDNLRFVTSELIRTELLNRKFSKEEFGRAIESKMLQIGKFIEDNKRYPTSASEL